MSIKYKYFTFFLLLYFLTPLNIKPSEKNIYELISQDKNLSIFFNYLKNTGLDVVLNKSLHGTGQFLLQVMRLLKQFQKNLKMKYYQMIF